MTTLTLDDRLAERLTHIATAQGQSLDVFANQALQQLAEAAPQRDTPQDISLPEPETHNMPRTLADELMPVLERIRAAQKADAARDNAATSLADDLEGLVGIVDSQTAIRPTMAARSCSKNAFADVMNAKYAPREEVKA